MSKKREGAAMGKSPEGRRKRKVSLLAEPKGEAVLRQKKYICMAGGHKVGRVTCSKRAVEKRQMMETLEHHIWSS